MPMGMKSPNPMKTFGRGRSYGELNSPQGSGAAKHPSFVLKERRVGRAKAASGAAQAQPGSLPSEPTTLTRVHRRGLAQANLRTGEGRGVGDPHGNQLCCPRCPRLKESAQHLHEDIPAVLGECCPKAMSLCVAKSPAPAA